MKLFNNAKRRFGGIFNLSKLYPGWAGGGETNNR